MGRTTADTTPERAHYCCPSVALGSELIYAIDSKLISYDLFSKSFSTTPDDTHSAPIRTICSSGEDNKHHLICSAGDDKKLVIYSRKLKIIGTYSHGKKITCASFSPDAKFIAFGDKFGDVYGIDLSKLSNSEAASDSVTSVTELEAKSLYGHLAIVTAICFAEAVGSDGKKRTMIITGDNHEKIRVGFWPECWNIHTFLLGHTGHITKLLSPSPNILVSGSADGSVRVWRLSDSQCLATHNGPQSLSDSFFPSDMELSRLSSTTGTRCVYIGCNVLSNDKYDRKISKISITSSDEVSNVDLKLIAPVDADTVDNDTSDNNSHDVEMSGPEAGVVSTNGQSHKSESPDGKELVLLQQPSDSPKGTIYLVNPITYELIQMDSTTGKVISVLGTGISDQKKCVPATKEKLYKYFKGEKEEE